MTAMETRTVKLRTGLLLEGVTHTEAVIREMTVEDVLEAERPTIVTIGNQAVPVPPSDNQRSLRTVSRRVVRIGTHENPGELLIRTLKFDDFGRLDAAMELMDKEHAAWGAKPEDQAGR
ncbi:MAG: hypothetical protein KG075_07595 [Alphaproteobacteria bacterium]|nr:hypothetical protein [Alphaproteobacteria bacterium]